MIASKDFAKHSRQVSADVTYRGFIHKALSGYELKRPAPTAGVEVAELTPR